MMADAAVYNIDRGAQIIDINMGCPAKKVCNKWAGSALMQDEPLALAIVEAVVAACAPHNVPVTLEDAHRLVPAPTRTRWCWPAAAESCRRADGDRAWPHPRAGLQRRRPSTTPIAAVKAACRIPVVANGDIDTPRRRVDVLAATGADAIMIGRAAQGRPWIFREIAHFLATGTHLAPPLVSRGANAAGRAPARPLQPVRRIHRRALGAQAHRLVRARTCRAAKTSASR